MQIHSLAEGGTYGIAAFIWVKLYKATRL